jgi:hypothetical protein
MKPNSFDSKPRCSNNSLRLSSEAQSPTDKTNASYFA